MTAKTLDNRGGLVVADESLDVSAAKRLDNRDGEISSQGVASVNAGQLDNRSGRLSAGSVLTVTAHELDNSAKGTLSSRGSLTVREAALDNQGGTLVADRRLDISGQSLDNRGGVVSGKADASIAVDGVLDNAGASRVVSEGRLSIAAGELRNHAGGQIGAKGDVEVRAGVLGQQAGELLSLGKLSVAARQLDNRDGGLIAAHQGIELRVDEALQNSRGEISTRGRADVRVWAGAGQAAAVLDNSQAGLVSGGQGLTLAVQRLLNHTKGMLTGGDDLLVVGDSLDNSAGGVLSSHGDLTLTLVGRLDNQRQGLITSAAGLAISAAHLDASEAGEVSAKGDLRLSVARLIQQQGRLIGEAGVHLDLQGGDLDNRGGLLSARGPMTLERLARLDNRGGEISSRQGYSLSAGAIDNGDEGRLISAGTLAIDLGQGVLRNAEGGLVSGWQGLAIKAGSLENSGQGTVSSRDGDLHVELSGALHNRTAGALVSKGQLSVDAQRLDNSAGGVISSAGDLSLALADTLDNGSGGLIDTLGSLSVHSGAVNNRAGQISSQQAASLRASGLDNSAGQLTSTAAMDLTLSGLLINAQKASLASGGPLVLQAAAIDNQGGSLLSQHLLQLTASDLDNSGGTLGARSSLELLLSGVLNNSADGLVHSQQGRIDLHAQRLDNSGGSLSGQQAVIARLSGALDNRGGRIESAQGPLDLHGASAVDNRAGVLNSLHGVLKLTSAGLFDNASGTAQGQTVTVIAKGLDNRGGHLSALGGDARVDVGSSAFDNQGGGLYAHQRVSVIAGDFDNQLDILNQGGKVAAERIDFSLSGALRNGSGILESATTLHLAAARIDNPYGRLRALGKAGTTQISGGVLDNRNGVLETANAELELSVADLHGRDGRILHTGAGRFGLSAALIMGAGGTLSTNAVLSLSASNWTNSAVIEADELVLDIGTFTQTVAGQLVARRAFSGRGDNWSNQGLLASDGTFSLDLSGAYAGDGQLTSLAAMTLGTGSLDLSSSARIASAAASTVVTRGLFRNEGRLTAAGNLTVSAAGLNNHGTLGSGAVLRLETPTLLNQRGLIFSGDDMALRLSQLTNRYADIYSLGALSITRDDQLQRSSLVENMSATLESAKDMRLAVETLENAKDTFVMQGKLLSAQAYLTCIQHCSRSWSSKRGRLTLHEEWGAVIAEDSPAGEILSGADLRIDSDSLINRYSTLSARKDLVVQTGDLQNIGAQAMAGSATAVFTAQPRERNRTYYAHQARVSDFMAQHGTAATFSEAAYLAMKAGFSPAYYAGIDAPLAVSGSEHLLAPAVIQAGGNVTVEASNSLANLQTYPNSAIDYGPYRGADVTLGRSTQPVVVLSAHLPPDLQQRQVNPLSLPGFSLPQGENGLFRLNTQAGSADSASQTQNQNAGSPWRVQDGLSATASLLETGAQMPVGAGPVPSNVQPSIGHKYLIETNPALTELSRFLSSDYMLGQLGYDPDQAQKRLGDGLYEQRLIRDAIVARTGQRYLTGLTSDEAMFRYLMNNAIASKDALNLGLGVSLSAQQVAALTHDIVWMEEQEVLGEKVLVPVLYLAQAEGRLAPNGALIQGRDVALIGGGDLSNQGTLRASGALDVEGRNIANSGLMQANERLQLLATESIRNAQGGIIAGRDVTARAVSGDLINERSVTTFESAGRNHDYRQDYVDSAARIEALNDLNLSAGRDVQNVGGALNAGHDLRVIAGRDLQIVSAQQHDLSRQTDRKGNSRREQVTQYGSEASAGRDLTLSTERDLAVVASRVTAGLDLAMGAGGDILIAAAANESHFESHRKSGGKRVDIERSLVTQQAAEVEAGGDLHVNAKNNLALSASNLQTDGEAYLYAGQQLAVVAAQSSHHSLYDMKQKGSWGSKKTQRDEITTVRNVGTSISTGGDLTLVSEGDQLYQKARLESGADLTLASGGAITFEAVKDLDQESHEKSKNSSMWTSAKGKGTTDETLLQSQMIAKGDTVISAVEGLNIDIKQVNRQTVSQTIDAMVKADPELAWLKKMEQRGDVDWHRVKEVHDSFKYSHSGVGAGAAIIIAILVTVLTAGAGTSVAGAAASATSSAGMGLAAQAGFHAVVSQAAISTISNKGNLSATSRDITSSDAMKGYALSAATAGIGTGVNPSSLGFNVQSVQQVARTTFVEAGLRTAIVGGNFTDNLGQAAVGQAANIVSGLIYKNLGDELRFSGTTGKVITHGIVGGLVAEAAGGSFKTGAIAAGLNEALVDTIIDLEFFQGPQHAQLVAMTSQLVGMTSAALVGGDEKEQQKAGWVAQQASLYNGLEHPTAERMLKELKDCMASGQCTAAKIDAIDAKYKELSAARSKGINECGNRKCVESILDKTIAMDDPVAKELLRFFQGRYDVPGLLQGNPDAVSAPSVNPYNKHGDRFVTDNQVAFAKYIKEGWLTAEETKFLDGWMDSTQWLERTYERPLSLQERATILASFSEEALLGIRGRTGQVITSGGGSSQGASSSRTITQAQAQKEGYKPCCFAAGTLVATPEGERVIESLNVGDVVWSKPEGGGEPFAAAITATHTRTDQPIYKVVLSKDAVDGASASETLEVTPGHPFYVPAQKGFVPVIDLKSGDRLQSLGDGGDGSSITVESITLYQPQGQTYNLTVDAGHTFYVGTLGAWVHNIGPCVSCSNGSCSIHAAALEGGAKATGAAGESAGAMRRLDYEAASYHGKIDNAVKSRAPVNGQEVLDFSIQVKPTSSRRVGIDYDSKDFVVFDKTLDTTYHGHVRSWSDLHPDMQKALQQAGMVDRKGNILTGGKR